MAKRRGFEGRRERDALGTIEVPDDVYYGAQTARAMANFPISGLRLPRSFIAALGSIKAAAATTNANLGRLDRARATAIVEAAEEVRDGRHDDGFVVDVFQTGSGTSTNMNANEIIANRASELLGAARGSGHVHPNDHVNLGQSSNDVIPTALHVAAIAAIQDRMIPGLHRLHRALFAKAQELDRVLKVGRTHLQDAVPMRLGQEFGGYARQVELGIERARRAVAALAEVALGGTAVGTGIGTHPAFARRVLVLVARDTGAEVREAKDHFEAQAAQDGVVEASGQLRVIAVSVLKICNDLRWLGSGPRAGLGELRLPATQPGSSIMPGKINPVIAESAAMVCMQVIGNDTAITLGGASGNLELNVTLPLLAHNLLQSIELLGAAAHNLAVRCVEGVEADQARCADNVERSLELATALTPVIGYEAAVEIVQKAHRQGKTIRQVAGGHPKLSAKKLKQLLDARKLTGR